MGNLYSSVSITGYNANAPSDDGTQTSSNQISWAKHKTKIGDPLKTLAEAINANVVTAFGKTSDGADVIEVGVDYDAAAADQGRLVIATAPNITIKTPDATVVNAPFGFEVLNDSGGEIIVDGFDAQTLNGEPTLTLEDGANIRLRVRGSNWAVTGTSGTLTNGAGAKTGDMVFRLVPDAKSGWIKSDGRTIGNASSSATSRANADTETLFKQLWTAHDNTLLPIQDSSGNATTRGGSAAADFAANKRLPTVDMSGYVPAGLDNMSGTGRDVVTNANADTLGKTMGAEKHTLIEAETAEHDHGVTQTPHGHPGSSVAATVLAGGGAGGLGTAGAYVGQVPGVNVAAANANVTINNAGGSDPHNNMQPTRFGYWWVKL